METELRITDAVKLTEKQIYNWLLGAGWFTGNIPELVTNAQKYNYLVFTFDKDGNFIRYNCYVYNSSILQYMQFFTEQDKTLTFKVITIIH